MSFFTLSSVELSRKAEESTKSIMGKDRGNILYDTRIQICKRKKMHLSGDGTSKGLEEKKPKLCNLRKR